jgi:hypothetical protein
MSAATCFRCDWEGSAHGRACPICGAPLYRPRAKAEPLRDGEEPSEPDRRPRRSLPPGVPIGVALAIALALVVAIERVPQHATGKGTGSANQHRDATVAASGSGTLVYLAASGAGRPPLWIVDLNGGGAGPGPVVPARTSELVDLSGAEPGWIGLERAGRDDRVSAAVVHGTQEDADIVGLGHGDLVAWGPGGTSLVFARNGHSTRIGCAPVRISLVTIASSREEWALNDPGFCGPVLSLSRSAAATYFTAASGDRLSVYLTGAVGVPHLMFDGVGVLSAAPPAAFLLSHGEAQQSLDEHRGRGGTLLGWKGIGGPISVGDGENMLTVDRILSWSADGSLAALVGTLGGRHGVFVLPAGSGTGPRVPRFVMPAGGVLDAAFGPLERLYVTTDDGILVDHAGSLVRLPVPEDAPAPAGPIVWMP